MLTIFFTGNPMRVQIVSYEPNTLDKISWHILKNPNMQKIYIALQNMYINIQALMVNIKNKNQLVQNHVTNSLIIFRLMLLQRRNPNPQLVIQNYLILWNLLKLKLSVWNKYFFYLKYFCVECYSNQVLLSIISTSFY